MNVYPPCADLYCPCRDHITTETHIPVCPKHSTPLVAADDPRMGRCVNATRVKVTPTLRRLGRFEVKHCTDWGVSSWAWKPRDLFTGDDLPPHNGWNVIDLEWALGVEA